MVYIFIALIFYSAAILLGAAASRNTNTNLAAALMNVISAIIPLVVAIPFVTRKNISEGKFGVAMALLAGVAIAVFTIALNKSYAVNKVGIVAPIVFGGALLLSTLLSWLIFKEKITVMESIGLGVVAVGLGILVYARVLGK